MKCTGDCNQGRRCTCRNGEGYTALELLILWGLVAALMYTVVTFIFWGWLV